MVNPKVLFLLLFSVEQILSEYCTRIELQSYTCPKTVKEVYAESYKTHCDVFFRCTQYRRKIRYALQHSICRRIVEKEVCCEGWGGPMCHTHTRAPIVNFCPGDENVTAVSTDPTYVKWSAPNFTEPEGYDLHISSTYGGQSASLSWGSHLVKYTARSRNNNKESHCSFMITVYPPKAVPQIYYYENDQTIERTPGQNLELTCYAMYSNPEMKLFWTLDSVNISTGARYWSEDSDFEGYKNSYNKLVLPIETGHNRKYLQCKGIVNGVTKELGVHIRVDVNHDPDVTYCPPEQILESATGSINASWETPHFYDRKGQQLAVYCNLPGINTKKESANFELNWGEHDVIYTAVNIETGRENTCTIKIKVQTKRCPELQVPENGALVCGEWTEGNTKICKLMCQDRYDPLLTDNVDSVYVCSGTGEWFPPPSDMACIRTKDNANPRMPSDLHYYTGSCSSDVTQKSMMTSFLTTLKNSFAGDICFHETCTTNNIRVEC